MEELKITTLCLNGQSWLIVLLINLIKQFGFYVRGISISISQKQVISLF